MTNEFIKRFLKSKNVNYLYHTNTVETSLSFIKLEGLLSRGLCEQLNLPQTYQYTDSSDRHYNIFNDIFFDSTEIQRRTGYSSYGPVLFVYNVDVIDTIEEGQVRITKKNPDKWSGTDKNSFYFNDEEDLLLNYDPYNFGHHITFVNQMSPLPFDYLHKVVLSDPHHQDNSLFERAKTEIVARLGDVNPMVSFSIRNYCYNDKFRKAYEDTNKLNDHFSLGGQA